MVHEKIEHLQRIPQFEQRSPEWFNQRKDKLTSSDAATVLDMNPYSKPNELLYQKCGIERPFVSNAATLHGQRYEDTAIEIYCRITGKVNYNFGLLCYCDIHKDYSDYNKELDFLGGSPDGIAESIDNPEIEPILIEVKCPYRRKIVDGLIPNCYIPQVQLNLLICNLNVADFIEYSPMDNKINIVRIYRDNYWLNKNIPILCNFWKNVIKYREIGIHSHPDLIIKEEKKIKRELNKRDKEIKKNQLLKKQTKKCLIID